MKLIIIPLSISIVLSGCTTLSNKNQKISDESTDFDKKRYSVEYNCGKNKNLTLYFEHIPKKATEEEKMIKAAKYYSFDPEFCARLRSSF